MRVAPRSTWLLPLSLLCLWALWVGGRERTRWQESCPPAVKLSLNRTGVSELTLLPGLGPARADLVVAERARGGPYASLDDLARRVKGVGPVLVRRWAPFLLVE